MNYLKTFECYRLTHRQTPSKLYTTPLRWWSINEEEDDEDDDDDES